MDEAFKNRNRFPKWLMYRSIVDRSQVIHPTGFSATVYIIRISNQGDTLVVTIIFYVTHEHRNKIRFIRLDVHTACTFLTAKTAKALKRLIIIQVFYLLKQLKTKTVNIAI